MLDATTFGWGHGMLLCTGSSALSALGLVCQRYAFLCHAGIKGESNVVKPWIIWGTGTIFLVLSTLPDVLSYFAASNVMLAVLGCLQPVFVSLMAFFLLHEAFTVSDLLGSSLCVIGAMGVIAAAPHESAANSHSFQVLPWEDPICRCYLVTMSALVVCLLSVLNNQSLQARDATHKPGNLTSVGMPFLVAAVATLGKLWNVQLAIAISDAHLSGGMWNLRWSLLGTIALMVVCALVAFVATQRGISDPCMESHVFIPSCFAFGVALNFIQAVVLKEFIGSPIWQVSVSALCAAIAVFGVFVMQWQPCSAAQDLKLCIDTEEGKRICNKGHQRVQRTTRGCVRVPPKVPLASVDEGPGPGYGAV